MLKFEETAEIGDLIKAFDFQPFPGRLVSYLVGHVIAKGSADNVGGTFGPRFEHTTSVGRIYAAYTVEVIHRVFGGEIVNACHDEVFVPFESTNDYDQRVIKI